MSEHTAIFDARAGHDHLANHRYPFARAEEARTTPGTSGRLLRRMTFVSAER
jgi:hypothetical protein